MIVGYVFMMETDSGVLPAEGSLTLYQEDQLLRLSSPFGASSTQIGHTGDRACRADEPGIWHQPGTGTWSRC